MCIDDDYRVVSNSKKYITHLKISIKDWLLVYAGKYT